MNNIAQIFKALGDETRLKILIILSKKKICARGIAKHLNISESSVSQHVKILKESGLIEGKKVGYYVHYDLKEDLLLDIAAFIHTLNSDDDLNKYNLDLHIFNNCNTTCKAKQNKCCQKL